MDDKERTIIKVDQTDIHTRLRESLEEVEQIRERKLNKSSYKDMINRVRESLENECKILDIKVIDSYEILTKNISKNK